ncbi:MAG: transcription-repair coupling factor [Armatimonadota bacterium]
MCIEKLAVLFLNSQKGVDLTDRLDHRQPAVVEGTPTPVKAFLAASLLQVYPKVLVVTANEEAARALHDDLQVFLSSNAYLVPPGDVWSHTPDAELAAMRVGASDVLTRPEGTAVLVGTVEALLQRTAGFRQRIEVAVGSSLDLAGTVSQLSEMGYERTVMVESPGQFAVRGGILDVYPPNADRPVRIELFGDEIDSIRSFDPDTQRSISRLDAVRILPAREEGRSSADLCMLELVPEDGLVVVDEPNTTAGHYEEFAAEFQARLARETATAEPSGDRIPDRDTYVSWGTALRVLLRSRRLYMHAVPRSIPWESSLYRLGLETMAVKHYHGQIADLAVDLREHIRAKETVVLLTERSSRVLELMGEHGVSAESGEFKTPGAVQVVRGRLSEGFRLPDIGLCVVTDVEMFGERRIPKPRRAFRSGTPVFSVLELKDGDYVVHINHGIGIYRGLVRLPEGDTQRDFLRIDYADGDKIYVPTDQLDRVQKYIGSGDRPPEIHRLGSTAWSRTTARVKARVQEMAKELLQLYAARAASEGYAYSPDTVWQKELEEAFPYVETPDQVRAIEEVKRDLESPTPTDRLICGDVGYGKTEVAVRAAFKAAVEGKQVAVLVPTTVLAEQHFDTFRERMRGFPIQVEMLSRFRTPADRRRVLQGLKDGSIDVVIGTHMLLSKNVQFRDLGLLIVDEEQRFGVVHKERLKQLRTTVDVITLTATPIPRTLHMALAGIRDVSIINTPPEGRLAIKTYLAEYSNDLVRRAILRELNRGGQVFVVYNRVERIEHVASRIERLVPQAKVGVGHGQMPERLLERVMWEFYHRQFNVLVCTTIIENGLDIPNANTMIIIDADRLGLAQLYQLRGRVGRSTRQAYCYLLYRPNRVLTEAAQKRLEAIREFTELGSGFQVAMRDLEIRGAGNLLGPEQSGFMESVGFELYCQMIADAVKELKGEAEEAVELPPVDIRVNAYIPTEYIPTESLRIAFYRRFASVRSFEELRQLREELEDRFGDLPSAVWNLLLIVHMRLVAHGAGITAVTCDGRRAVYRLGRLLTRTDMSLLALRHKSWYPEADKVEVDLVGRSDILRAVGENLIILAGHLNPEFAKSIVPLRRRPRRRTAAAAV